MATWRRKNRRRHSRTTRRDHRPAWLESLRIGGLAIVIGLHRLPIALPRLTGRGRHAAVTG
jgi:hypothetical protein